MITKGLACGVAALALAGCKFPDFTLGPRSPRGIDAVYVSPAEYVFIVGDTVRLTAVATTKECDIEFCRESAVPASFTWSSSDPSIVTVSNGLARAVGRGTAYVRAVADSVAGKAEIHVGSGYVPLARVSLGGRCGLTDAGAVYCWGGLPIASPDTAFGLDTPRLLAGGLTFASVMVGSTMGCGIATDARGYCWGSGYLGGEVSSYSGKPVLVTGGLTFQSLSPGKRSDFGNPHTCGVAADGAAWCWGSDDVGQLGTDSAPLVCYDGVVGHNYRCSTVPLRVAGGPAFTSISAGGKHTCALTSDGTAYCWGDNTWGQLGDGSTQSRTEPASVSGAPALTSLAAGVEHTCGLTSQGTAWCWGRNEGGELGIGSLDSSAHPVPVPVLGGAQFTSLDAAATTCGLDPAGQVYCWGGALTAPTLVPGGLTFGTIGLSIASGAGYSVGPRQGMACGIAADLRAYCWTGAGNPVALRGPVRP